MKLSVVTTTFNRSEQMYKGLSSLASCHAYQFEFVVVDDGSSDDTKEMFDKLESENKDHVWKYIKLDHPEHRISSIPRNVGIKNASCEIIMFTEPECLHLKKSIFDLVESFGKDPEHSHLASQVWTIQEKVWKSLTEDNFKRPETIFTHPYAQLTDSANLNNTKAPNSDWAITGQKNCTAGCLFITKREWLEDVGGFDESFEGHGFDDFDLFERLAVYGHGIVKHDDIAVFHQWHEKNYPYNIYDMAERNGQISAERTNSGEYRANIGKEWGQT